MHCMVTPQQYFASMHSYRGVKKDKLGQFSSSKVYKYRYLEGFKHRHQDPGFVSFACIELRKES